LPRRRESVCLGCCANLRWRQPSSGSCRVKQVRMSNQGVRSNPSLERTSTGLALGPRAVQCHHPSRGPSANPAGSAQLKR
jgi:hypothetical protein